MQGNLFRPRDSAKKGLPTKSKARSDLDSTLGAATLFLTGSY